MAPRVEGPKRQARGDPSRAPPARADGWPSLQVRRAKSPSRRGKEASLGRSKGGATASVPSDSEGASVARTHRRAASPRSRAWASGLRASLRTAAAGPASSSLCGLPPRVDTPPSSPSHPLPRTSTATLSLNPSLLKISTPPGASNPDSGRSSTALGVSLSQIFCVLRPVCPVIRAGKPIQGSTGGNQTAGIATANVLRSTAPRPTSSPRSTRVTPDDAELPARSFQPPGPSLHSGR